MCPAQQCVVISLVRSCALGLNPSLHVCLQAADGVVPEDVGQLAAARLLEEVGRGGVVDTAHQPLVLLLCALGPDELNQVRLGPISGAAMRTLRLLRDFMGVTFAVQAEEESKTVFLSCLGSGFRNNARRVG